MFDKKALGEIIRQQRKSKHMTQQQLSQKTNLSRPYISDIESGRYAPGVQTLSRIAEALDMDLNIIKSMGSGK